MNKNDYRERIYSSVRRIKVKRTAEELSQHNMRRNNDKEKNEKDAKELFNRYKHKLIDKTLNQILKKADNGELPPYTSKYIFQIKKITSKDKELYINDEITLIIKNLIEKELSPYFVKIKGKLSVLVYSDIYGPENAFLDTAIDKIVTISYERLIVIISFNF